MCAEATPRVASQNKSNWVLHPKSEEKCKSTGFPDEWVISETRLGLSELGLYLHRQTHPSISSGLTPQIEEMLRRVALLQIRIPNPVEVRQYLLDKVDGLLIIESVCVHTAEKFIGVAQLSLELYKDPEIDARQLTLFVRANKYSSEIMDEIDQIRDRCDFLPNEITDWLFVTTDFQPPK